MLCLFFLALWIAATFTSHGFLEDDAWTHYLYARFAVVKPAYLLDEWGRPMCTGLYALAATFGGVIGARAVSLLVVAIITWLTARVARRLSIPPVAAVAFLLGQPMLFLHSLSVMTELPFAAILLAGFDAATRRRWWLASAFVSLLPLTRPEGFGFLLLMAGVLIAARRWLALPILVLPLVAWSVLGWIAWGRPADSSPARWLIDHWPWSAASAYGHGSIFQFIALLPVLLGVGVPFVIVGCIAIIRRTHGFRDRAILHQPVLLAMLAVAAIPLAALVGHSILWWAGKMASFGEVRYLLIAAPFWAMLAAIGWQAIGEIGSPVVYAAISLAAIGTFKLTTLRESREGDTAQRVVAWYRGDPAIAQRWPIVIASHPAVEVLLGVTPDDGRHADWSPAALAAAGTDTLVIWDPKCGPFNADRTRVNDVPGLEAMGFRVVRGFEGRWFILAR